MRIAMTLLLLASAACVYGQTSGAISFEFPAHPTSAVLITAPGAKAEKQGRDVELVLPIVQLTKNVPKASEVEYKNLSFVLYRREADGKIQYVDSSEKDERVRGKLSDRQPSATYRSIRLRYPGGAAVCQEICFVQLNIFVEWPDPPPSKLSNQTGGISGRAELKFK